MSLRAKCPEVSTAWNILCGSEGEGCTFVSHLKVGDNETVFFTLSLEKNAKIPQASPASKNVPSLRYKGPMLRSHK